MKPHEDTAVPALISLSGVDVALGGKSVLSGLSWRLGRGEHWAVVGSNGAGKTSFLKLLRGELWPSAESPGRRLYCFDGAEQESPLGIRKRIALVSAELHDAYLKNGWDMTGEEVILTGLFDTAWLDRQPDAGQAASVADLIRLLHLGGLSRKRILELSLGEARKLLLARALAGRPRVLILDEVCSGLDLPSRRRILALVEAAAQAGTQLIYATHRVEELVPSITHALLLKNGRIIKQGEKEEVLTRASLDEALGRAAQRSPRPPAEEKGSRGALPSLVAIENADVYLKHKKVLQGITWEMKEDENWAVLGGNGAGKSTLLKLITAEVSPALGGRVSRFGSEEPESVWRLRKKIGLVSPDLHVGHAFSLTGREVVQSGFFSSIGLYERVSKKQQAAAEQWIAFFRLEALADREVTALSYGELRKLLIARAMVNAPALLLLDEPASGLDSAARADFLDTLEHLCRDTATRIVLVTHHLDELVPSITHAMVMGRGKIIAQGKKEDILREEKSADYFGEE